MFVDDPARMLLLRTLLLRILLLRPHRMPLLDASPRMLPADDNRLERLLWLIDGFISSSLWLTTDLNQIKFSPSIFFLSILSWFCFMHKINIQKSIKMKWPLRINEIKQKKKQININFLIPCIVKHCVNLEFVNGISANAWHRVTVIVEQTKTRWIWATGCVSSWTLHFFNRIKITGHHFFSLLFSFVLFFVLFLSFSVTLLNWSIHWIFIENVSVSNCNMDCNWLFAFCFV